MIVGEEAGVYMSVGTDDGQICHGPVQFHGNPPWGRGRDQNIGLQAGTTLDRRSYSLPPVSRTTCPTIDEDGRVSIIPLLGRIGNRFVGLKR